MIIEQRKYQPFKWMVLDDRRKLMDKFGLFVVFFLAIIPNPFFDLAGLLAGAAHLPKWKFFLTVLLGKTIQPKL